MNSLKFCIVFQTSFTSFVLFSAVSDGTSSPQHRIIIRLWLLVAFSVVNWTQIFSKCKYFLIKYIHRTNYVIFCAYSCHEYLEGARQFLAERLSPFFESLDLVGVGTCQCLHGNHKTWRIFYISFNKMILFYAVVNVGLHVNFLKAQTSQHIYLSVNSHIFHSCEKFRSDKPIRIFIFVQYMRHKSHELSPQTIFLKLRLNLHCCFWFSLDIF